MITLGATLTSCVEQRLPDVTEIEIQKSSRQMILRDDGETVRVYDIGLGRNPVGDKAQQGDGRTPEGSYIIDRKNPKSRFFLSLGISYPDARDRREAARAGVNPGGDIFIHGEPNSGTRELRRDWTDGCIAVSNSEMSDIYEMVAVGTTVTILP